MSRLFFICLVLSVGDLTAQSQRTTIESLRNNRVQVLKTEPTVTISGIVTLPTHLINPSVFYIQDGLFGLRCYGVEAAVSIGDSLTLTGKIIEYNGEMEIVLSNLSDIIRHGKKSHIQTYTAGIQKILKEMPEGRLIHIIGGKLETKGRSILLTDKEDSIFIFADGKTVDRYIPHSGNLVRLTAVLSKNRYLKWNLIVRHPSEIFFHEESGIVPISYAFLDVDQDFTVDKIGEQVKIKGTVITNIRLPSGSSLIHMFDSTGGTGLFFNQKSTDLKKGDIVTVVGRIAQFGGFNQLNVTDLIYIHSGEEPKPIPIELKEFNSKKYQGQYVTIVGDVKKSSINDREGFITLTDGLTDVEVYFPNHLKINPEKHNYTTEHKLKVSGVASQYDLSPPFDAGYQLKVISLEDISVISSPSILTWKLWALIISIIAGVSLISISVIYLLRKQIQEKTFEANAKNLQLEFESQITQELNKRLTIKDIIEFTTSKLWPIIPVDTMLFFIPENNTYELFQVEALGKGVDSAKSYSQINASELLDEISTFDSVQLFLRNQLLSIQPYLKGGCESALVFPIKDENHIIAICVLASNTDLSFYLDFKDLLSRLSNHLAIGLKNAKLFSDLEKAILELKMAQSQLIQSEKLKAIGQLSFGLAHDFNNTLAIIIGTAQLLKRQITDTEHLQKLSVIEKAALDGAAVVSKIQAFSREKPHSGYDTLEVTDILEDVILITKTEWKNKKEMVGINITIQRQFGGKFYIQGNASELRTVFTNVFLNALDAMKQSGSIFVKTFKDGDYCQIDIQDTGTGMTNEVKEKVFDPFFTTKGVNGTGLGMSQVYGIVKRHGGEVQVESELGVGSLIRFRFLLSQNVDTNNQVEVITHINEHKTATILIVEDEPDISSILHELLNTLGYQNQIFNTAEEALESFSPGKYQLLITDIGLPGLSGWNLIERLRKIQPDLAVLVISGWGNQITEEQLKHYQINELLTKPFSIGNVSSAIERLI